MTIYDPLAASLRVLHDRGLVNVTALLAVLHELEDGKAASLDQIAGIFPVAHEADRTRLWAEYTHIHDLLLAALDFNDMRRALLQLVSVLRDECRPRLEVRR